MEVLSSRILLRPSDPERSHRFYRDILGLAVYRLLAVGVTVTREPRREPWGLVEMWTEDPDGTPIVLVEVPEEHPLRRDPR